MPRPLRHPPRPPAQSVHTLTTSPAVIYEREPGGYPAATRRLYPIAAQLIAAALPRLAPFVCAFWRPLRHFAHPLTAQCAACISAANRVIVNTVVQKSTTACPSVVVAQVGGASWEVTRWDFNSAPSDGWVTTGSLRPVTGWGRVSAIGGVVGSFVSGAGSSDPAGWTTVRGG